MAADYYVPKPIPILEEVILAQAAALGMPEEASAVLQRVRYDLLGLQAHQDQYNSKHRGKTVRDKEVASLLKLINRVEEDDADLSETEKAWVEALTLQLGKAERLPGRGRSDIAKFLRELTERLDEVICYKLDRKWRPYLYGVVLPQIAWDTALIPPTMDKDDDGEHFGPIIDFVRACLRELGEKDAKPETVAHEVKRNKAQTAAGWRYNFPIGQIAGKKSPPVT